MTSKATTQRSHLTFMALAGLVLGMRPLLWVSGLIGSVALRFLWQAAAETARASSRHTPVPPGVIVFPALVMFGLSFFLL